jgi:hypothetical protein
MAHCMPRTSIVVACLSAILLHHWSIGIIIFRNHRPEIDNIISGGGNDQREPWSKKSATRLASIRILCEKRRTERWHSCARLDQCGMPIYFGPLDIIIYHNARLFFPANSRLFYYLEFRLCFRAPSLCFIPVHIIDSSIDI